MTTTFYKVTCSNGQSYTEACWKTLEEALQKAKNLASYGFAVRVRDWCGGPILFAAGDEPASVYRKSGIGAADRVRELLQETLAN